MPVQACMHRCPSETGALPAAHLSCALQLLQRLHLAVRGLLCVLGSQLQQRVRHRSVRSAQPASSEGICQGQMQPRTRCKSPLQGSPRTCRSSSIAAFMRACSRTSASSWSTLACTGADGGVLSEQVGQGWE